MAVMLSVHTLPIITAIQIVCIPSTNMESTLNQKAHEEPRAYNEGNVYSSIVSPPPPFNRLSSH